MKEVREASTVKIGSEDWIVRYYSQVLTPKEGKYVKAARLPSRKEIWLSLNDAAGKKFDIKDITVHLQAAILPYVVEAKKKEFGEDKVNAAMSELRNKV